MTTMFDMLYCCMHMVCILYEYKCHGYIVYLDRGHSDTVHSELIHVYMIRGILLGLPRGGDENSCIPDQP